MTKRFTKQIVTLFIFVLAFTFILGNPIDATAATKYVKVTFNAMGGSAVSAKKVVYNKYVPTPKTPKKNGYTFAGWYKDSKYKTAWNFKSNKVTKNTTLYAKWKPITYKVNFNSKGGTSVASQTVNRNGLAKTPSKPARPGYSFVNWYKDTKYKTVWKFSSNHVTGNVTLYAKWKAQSAKTVKFETNSGTPIASQTVPYNSLLTIPATTKVGCTFAGWFIDSALTSAWNTSSSRLTSDITLYAKWTTNNYTVTFNSNGGSTVNNQVVAFGSPITQPTAPTKTGYTFAGWFSDDKLTTAWNFVTLCPANNVTLYAKWNITNYTVTLKANYPGGPDTTVTVPYNSTFTKVTTTRVGYVLDTWYKDTGLTTPWNFSSDKVTDNITLYARWCNVTFDTQGGSAVTPQSVALNATILPPAAPTKAGSIFEGWYKDDKFTTAWDFVNDKITVSDKLTTLYAKWVTSASVYYTGKMSSNILSVNMHSTTDTSSASVGSALLPNQIIKIHPSTTDGWYQIDNNGTPAYFVTKMPTTGTVTAQLTAYAATVSATGSAKIYTSADATSTVVSTINKGQTVNVIPVPENPYFVQVSLSNSKIGYMLKTDIQQLFYDTLNIHTPSPVALTATQINDAIANYEKDHGTSVFHGMGQDFIDVAKAAGINPLIFTSIAIHESAWGTSELAKNKFNIFSLRAYDGAAYDSAYKYNSVKDAMKAAADFLNNNYIHSSITGISQTQYAMMGDFLGTGGLAGIKNAENTAKGQGAVGINYYYSVK